MNLKKSFIVVAFIAISLPAFVFQVSAQQKVLFERAKFTMETKGDLEGAIELFEKIIVEYPEDRPVVAKALLHIGMCYEKLGLKVAQNAYQRIVSEFADQIEVLNEARARLAALKLVSPAEPEGIVVRQVWAGSDVDYLGAPSPDGRYLSFVDWKTGDLAIREIETGENRHLTNKGSWNESNEFALFSKWSPDSKQVVYVWQYKDSMFDLRVVGLDGSKPRILYQNEEVQFVYPYDSSPDGKHILACFSRKAGTNQIVLISIADGSVRVLKTVVENFLPDNMIFSPDSRYIVYDSPQNEDSPERDIYLLLTDGSLEIPLVEHPANDFLLGWAPDGKNILFASNRTGTQDAWIIPFSDGKTQGDPELIKRDIGGIIPLGFTQEGSYYYALQTGMRDVYIAMLDLKQGKLLTPPKKVSQRYIGSNVSPDWSPDGKYLAYVSDRSHMSGIADSRVLCIRSDKTGKERQLSLKMSSFQQPRWSFDGRSIFIYGREKQQRQKIYQIDAQTGDFIPTSQYMPKKWLRSIRFLNEKEIFYMHYNLNNKLFRILLRNLETGKEKELYKTSFSTRPTKYRRQLALSTDGRWLAFIEGSFLKVMPAAGGEPRDLFKLKESEGITALAWTADSREVLIARSLSSAQDQKCELWRIPVEGGEPQSLGLAMDRLLHLCVHPDGQRIAFTAGNASAEIWVMENFLPENKKE